MEHSHYSNNNNKCYIENSETNNLLFSLFNYVLEKELYFAGVESECLNLHTIKKNGLEAAQI